MIQWLTLLSLVMLTIYLLYKDSGAWEVKQLVSFIQKIQKT